MKFTTGLIGGVISCAMAISLGSQANAQQANWKFSSAYNRTVPIFGEAALGIAQKTTEASNRQLRIQFFDPGALVPAAGIFDAVGEGAIDAGYAGTGFFVSREPALAFFDSIPFGPGLSEYIAWIKDGGGAELRDEILKPYNIKALTCGVNMPEAGGWYNKEINSGADFSGLKMRIVGLGGRVLEKLGASTQILAPGDIYPSLERGVIDATEFSNPASDLGLGLYEVAKYYYFPGWQQQISFQTLFVNLDRWNELPSAQQQLLEAVCAETMIQMIARGESAQTAALAEFRSKDVEIRTFPDVVLSDVKAAWEDVRVDLESGNENFAKVSGSLRAFQEDYKQWSTIGYLK
ncbi:TRAP transporter substrate-binding protein [Hoeflea sp. G2-23]|uniref:TRAP transporter substrate-binding protein n=1 Tax=Hoeflea algicola TaxID=2983763 RepID=A0ABT3Z4X9_9HYPH|nr:TRAP transporter substrate-binding protein [Hoeflea algicola]MCY0146828.1 TRAP transporter substrate-binding protein [Hoeflea algicola]